MKTIVEPAREVPVVRDVDVCVLGGGPGGITAAWQAAKHGAKTLLVEHYGFLGGMATAGLVGPILGLREVGKDAATVEGMTREFADLMLSLGAGRPWEEHVRTGCIPFEAETFKLACDQMCGRYGVDLLLHSTAVGAVVEEGALRAVTIENKSGRQAIMAKCFVDATGDADIAFRAGAECTLGRPVDNMPMANGSTFHVGGLENLTDEMRKAAAQVMDEARQEGIIKVYGLGVGGQGSTLRAGFTSINCTRWPGNPADVEVLTEGEVYTRDMIHRIVKLWRERVPGMENAYLALTPTQLGLRESRQLVGEKRVVGADVVEGKKLADAVARCSYWIDIHCPRGFAAPGVHLCWKKCAQTDCYMMTEHMDMLPDELYPPDYFDIPYGALVPAKLDNLLVSGRCCSLDYQAMSAARVMGPVMAIGEACGVAAAMAADGRKAPREVEVEALREKLLAAGCVC
ncbi:MAG: FAD-dependent oxidoreductase [Armatimonadia bacterium]